MKFSYRASVVLVFMSLLTAHKQFLARTAAATRNDVFFSMFNKSLIGVTVPGYKQLCFRSALEWCNEVFLDFCIIRDHCTVGKGCMVAAYNYCFDCVIIFILV